MNRLELGRYWVARLSAVMPDAPHRVCIRMAWHLAALGVQSDGDLQRLPESALGGREGGSPHFVRLRLLYQQRLSAPHPAPSNILAFSRPPADPPDKSSV